MEAATQDRVENYQTKFANAIATGDCELTGQIICDEALTMADICQELPETGENVLQFVVRLENTENSARIVGEILNTIQTKFPGDQDTLVEFLNHSNRANKFPLDLAFEKNCFDVVSILIRCGARKFSTAHLELYKEIYDLGIKLKRNSFDISNKDGWLIEYNYKNISGSTNQAGTPHDNFRETEQLGLILDLSREKRSDLMRHPLVQIFVTEKYKRYSWLITFSIVYHILWSLMSATYIMCVDTLVTTEKSIRTRGANDNFIDVEPNIAKICAILKISGHESLPVNGAFSVVLAIFIENIGQWTSIAALISSSLYISSPKFALVPPMTLLFTIYCWKLSAKWFGSFDTYFNLSTNLDKYVLLGTFICICFMPTLSIFFWSFFGVYCSGFFITLILLPFAFPERFLRRGSKKCILNRISYIFQGIGIFCLLGLFAYFPFEPTCTCNFPSYVCAAGIAASLFLVQGQMTKTETYGVYTQMLMKGFKIISLFLLTFLPVLAAYFVIFILLLPDNSNFGLKNGLGIGKIVAMLTGDLGFDDIFSDDAISLIPHVIPANIALTFFSVTVVLLLQNLLVGLTVNDLEKLRKKAVSAHVANRLEIIYMLENVIMHKWSRSFLELIQLRGPILNYFSVAVTLRDGVIYQRFDDQSGITVKFWELAKPIREVIEEKQDVYVKN